LPHPETDPVVVIIPTDEPSNDSLPDIIEVPQPVQPEIPPIEEDPADPWSNEEALINPNGTTPSMTQDPTDPIPTDNKTWNFDWRAKRPVSTQQLK